MTIPHCEDRRTGEKHSLEKEEKERKRADRSVQGKETGDAGDFPFPDTSPVLPPS